VIVLILIAIITVIVWITGGTTYVWPHLYYIPIVLSAYWFAPFGGIVASIISGLATGPFMPLVRETLTYQSPLAWRSRVIFFSIIGLIVGFLVKTLKTKMSSLQQKEKKLSKIAAELEEIHNQTLRALTLSIEARDLYTRYHSDRVARYAMAISQNMGQPKIKTMLLGWAGLMHDLGKIGIPEEILQKKGKLTDKERAVVHKHPLLSYKILRPVKAMDSVINGILHHHERYDGSGYPSSLEGDEIPLQSRILAVADVFEALTADRPYRKAWPKQEAVKYILKNSGKLFDPKVVKAFSKAHKQLPIQVDEKELHIGSIGLRDILLQA